MNKGLSIVIVLWMFLMQPVSAASPPKTPASKAIKIMQSLDNPVGLRALESFAGKDRSGKDGLMVKLGLDLTLIYQEHRDFKMKGGEFVLRRPFKSSLKLAHIRDEKIVIDVVAGGSINTLVQELTVLGMESITTYGRMVSGRIPIASLEQAATIASLRFARPAYAKTSAGAITSQGDAALLSNDARSLYGIDGTGVTVGTLSDSYDCLGGAAADVVSNDLPSGVLLLAEEIGCSSGTDEGRAMMQIVHDVAPGASQAFHTAFNGEASFAQGIIDLANAGSNIINDDVIYFAEPMFQDGVIAQAVDSVKAMGVPYFSAAGNSASDSYEADFVNSGLVGTFFGSTRHDFDAGAGTDGLMTVSIPPNTQVIFVLQWDDPYFSVSGGAGADSDVDMLLYSSTGVFLSGGFSNNIGGDAVEIFSYTTGPGPTMNYQLGIEHFSGPFPGKVKFVFFGSMTVSEHATNSSTSYGHPIAAGGQAVGAARYSNTPDFGVTPPIAESFSSKGGTPILFDTAGNPVNEIRQKPDFVAPDGGDNTFFGFDFEGNGWPNFFGTSAAAPHAAGMAALLKEFDSTQNPDSIYMTMQAGTVDMDAAGFDFNTGHGLIQATLALALLDVDADTIPNSQDNCPDDANTTQDDFDSDGLGDVCDPDDDNDGLSDVDEAQFGTNPFLVDTDGDTLGDGDEVNIHGSDPTLMDTDSDGFDDDVEVAAGSDPNDDQSIPGVSSGDINGDGNVDAIDILLATRMSLGPLAPTTNQLLRGDVAPQVGGVAVPDGAINISDLIVIQQWVFGP